jgi:alpha-L-fucosidase 2
MRIIHLLCLLLVTFAPVSHAGVPSSSGHLRLWYTHPALSTTKDAGKGQNNPEWLKALPVGNGFLGAMVFGDVNRERIQLNEKSLWSGSPQESDNPNAYPALDSIRQFLFQGRYREATELTLRTQVCKGPDREQRWARIFRMAAIKLSVTSGSTLGRSKRLRSIAVSSICIGES